jgi:hypothetical protein
MPLDASIILAGRQAPIENPMQMYSQAVQTQGMREQQAQAASMYPLQQQAASQEIQKQQIAMQEAQYAQKARQIISQGVQSNMAPDGTIDYAGVAKHLAQNGFGASAPGVLDNGSKIRANAAKALQDDLSNKATLISQMGQLANGVADEASFQKVRKPMQDYAAQMGWGADTVPEHYDEKVLNQFKMAAPKFEESLRHAEVGAHLGAILAPMLPKTTAEWQSLVNQDLANTKSDDDYKRQLAKYRGIVSAAAGGHLPDTGLAAVLSAAPDAWTPEVAENARYASVRPEDQEKYTFQTAIGAAKDLQGAPTVAEYEKRRVALPERIRSRFPDYSTYEDSEPITSEDKEEINSGALTPAEQQRASELGLLYGSRSRLYDAQADWNARRPATPATADSRKALMQRLASLAYNNAAQGKNKTPTYQEVAASVLDPANYVDEDTNAPEMNANRLEVAQYLQGMERQGLGIDRLKQQIANTKGKSNLDRIRTTNKQGSPAGQAAQPAPGASGGRGAPSAGATAAPSAAQAPAAPKVFPRSKLHSFAQSKNLTDAQAENGLRNLGYQVK